MSKKEKLKAIVIGIDGGTWRLIKPLMNEGKLPNLKKIVDNGASGVLESTIPPITGPAWSSFATGCTPLKHGVLDFVLSKDRTERIASTKDFKCEPFYKILSDYGHRCIFIALPLSYPPIPIDGIILPDFFSPNLYAYPPEASKYMKNYRIKPDFSKKGNEFIEDLIKFENEHMDSAKQLFKNVNWDLFFIHFITSDVASHKYFGDMMRRNEMGLKAIKVIQNIDKHIGWFMGNMPDESIILIISDHGFKEYNNIFNINTWLKNEGYLNIKPISENRKKEIFDLTDTRSELIIPPFMEKLKKIKIVRKLLKWIFIYTMSDKYKVRSGYQVDYDNSLFYMPRTSSFGIYANRNKKSTENIKNLYQKMTNLRDSENIKIFDKVTLIEYDDDQFPVIMFLPNEKYYISPKIERNVFEKNKKIYFHDIHGIFAVYGKYVKKKLDLRAKIYDIPPTILHLLNTPIPPHMDGSSLLSLFMDELFLSIQPPNKIKDIRDDVLKKIKRIKGTF